MRWGILERGISGDLDEALPDEERTRRTVRILAEYVQEMAKARWPELLPMALTVLQDLSKAEGDEQGQGGDGNEHLAALEHFRVPDASQIEETGPQVQQGQGGAPDSESGALVGAYLRGFVERRREPIVQPRLFELDDGAAQDERG